MDDTYVVFSFESLELLLFRLDLFRECGDHLFNLSNVLDWVKKSDMVAPAHSIAVCLQCWNDILDRTFNEHTADQTKTFAIRLLRQSFVQS